MASWSSRQRAKYTTILILALVILVGIPLFLFFYETPTCFDGKQNGDEEGIDCGGLCEKVCSFEAVEPIIHWSRLFEVIPGMFSVVALVENPNFAVGAQNVPYVFRIRDDKNILIYERKGAAFIPPKEIFPIFETRIVTGERVPKRVFFEFGAQPEWQKVSGEKPDLFVSERQLSLATTTPRLDAVLENRGRRAVSNVEVVAILYDANDNAVAASQTFVGFLGRGESADIVFTWPSPFDEPPVKIDIVPKAGFDDWASLTD